MKNFLARLQYSAFTTMGGLSKTTYLNTELHKLTLGFVVAASNHIYPGMPVKLDNTGKVVAFDKADDITLLIGFAYNEANAGENLTIFCKGFLVIYALSTAAITPGPVTYGSYDTADSPDSPADRLGYVKIVAVGTDEAVIGWVLDVASGANKLVRVLLAN